MNAEAATPAQRIAKAVQAAKPEACLLWLVCVLTARQLQELSLRELANSLAAGDLPAITDEAEAMFALDLEVECRAQSWLSDNEGSSEDEATEAAINDLVAALLDVC